MSDNYREDAVKQYLRHFRVWFLIVAIGAVVTLAAGVVSAGRGRPARANTSAPKERVYDEAGILTDAEEDRLREYIAEKEARYRADFVIYTFSRPVEGQEALDAGCRSTDWERNMTDIADDFWDENGYGYNRDFEGDGSILIDNRYPGQRGEWLSTSGKVEDALGVRAVENVLYAVDDYYDSDPCRAYMRYIDRVCGYLDGGGVRLGGAYYLGAFVVSLIIAGAYAASHLGKNRAQDTTAVNAYVAGGKPELNDQRDDFIRKSVVTRKIETSSGSGGGRSSGGGGHHTSSGGASHGGGGHRH